MSDSTRRDLKDGWRGLRRGGISTVATVVTLAIGIGAMGTIFSLLNGVLLRDLPYAEPDRLVMAAGYVNGKMVNISPVTLRDWQTSIQGFDGIAAWAVRSFSVTGEPNPEQVPGAFVTANYFAVLGREAGVGRTFVDREGEVGANDVVVLSHDFWQRRFGSDAPVLGRRLEVNGEAVTVVGVMPADFESFLDVELWLPLAFSDEDLAEEQRTERYLATVGRLAPGVSMRQAERELQALARRITEANPRIDRTWSAKVITLDEAVVGDFRPILFTLLAAAGLVLLLVVANVINLMVARYLERQGELALRSALGAGRGALLRQLVVEACMLSVAGGALGLFLAWVGTRLLVVQGPQDIPRLQQVGVDGTVVAFVLLLSVVTGVVVGLLPALRVSRFSLQDVVKEGSVRSSASRERNALRNVLVVSQVALAVALLVGASLLVTSLRNLLDIDLGFDPDDVLVMRVVQSSSTPMEQSRIFSSAVLERLQALPGVRRAAVASNVPLLSSRLSMEPLVEGRSAQDPLVTANYEVVSPDFFSTLGIEIVAGRPFTEADRSAAPRVAIVNELLARRLWPNGEAMGSRVSFDDFEGPWWTVVGIIANVHRFDAAEEPPLQIMVPWGQEPWYFMTFVVRSEGEPEALMPAVRRAVWDVDDDQAIALLTTMEEMISESMARRRFTAFLIATFGIAALLLTAVGLYGVMAYLAAQRHHEMAIRLALGAQRGDILGAMLRRTLLLLAAGVAAGLLVEILFARFLEGLLFEVDATDIGTLVTVVLLVGLVGLVASFLPAFRSSRTDPALVLRQ